MQALGWGCHRIMVFLQMAPPTGSCRVHKVPRAVFRPSSLVAGLRNTWRLLCEQVCVFSGVCATDQSAEPLRWVSTGDSGGVNSDLHHFLHVGGRRLTGVELPSRPPLRATQRATRFKRSRGLTVARCRQVEQHEDEAAQVGGHVGPTGSPSGRHTRRPLPHFNPPLETCF